MKFLIFWHRKHTLREVGWLHDRLATAVLLFGVLLCLTGTIKSPFNYYDEGFSVYNATRIFRGDVPHKDFWTIYPPGQFYVLAVIFKIFGATLMTARIYDTIVRFMIVMFIYLIAKKTSSNRGIPHILSAFVTVLLSPQFAYTYALFPALALGLLSVIFLLKCVTVHESKWAVLAGACIGLAAFFRWDIALYNGVGLSIALLIHNHFRNKDEGITGRAGRRLLIFSVLAFLGPCFATVLLLYGHLGLISGFDRLWDQLFVFPLTTYREVRWLPYPGVIPPLKFDAMSIIDAALFYWFSFYVPLLIYCLAILYYAVLFLRNPNFYQRSHFIPITFTISGALLLTQALNRFDYPHLMPTAIYALVVLFLVLFPIARRMYVTDAKPLLQFFIMLLLAIANVFYLLPQIVTIFVHVWTTPPVGCYSRIERGSCVHLSSDQELAVQYIVSQTQEDELIFVGNHSHDRILINDVGFYFLSNRHSATFYHELHPGVATTQPVQEAIVTELENRNVTWIVLVNIPQSEEPNASGRSSAVYVLDAYIRSEHTPVVKFGDYEIWKKR